MSRFFGFNLHQAVHKRSKLLVLTHIVKAQSDQPARPAKALSAIGEIKNKDQPGIPSLLNNVIEKTLELAEQSQ